MELPAAEGGGAAAVRYVVNGLYLPMRAPYVAAAAKVLVLVVEWPHEKLSWADFRCAYSSTQARPPERFTPPAPRMHL